MAFKKGQSSNPGGGPRGSKLLDLHELLAKKSKADDHKKEYYVDEFLDYLIYNYKEDARLMIWMGDHLFGKAPQRVELTSGGEKLPQPLFCMYSITTPTKKVAALSKRIRVIQGGTSAGKTIGTLEVLIDLAQRDKTPTLTSVVSESFPHLRRGAMRDFLSIMQAQDYPAVSVSRQHAHAHPRDVGSAAV